MTHAGFTAPPAMLGALSAADWWTLSTGVVCAVACGVAGCYLVLRRMSLLGDAISHAVLPGLAVAFILTGTRDPLAMLTGAAGAGVATAGLSAGLSRVGRIAEDAALGVVFTVLFALGVILLAFLPSDLHLDASCVLYGNLEFVALDTVRVLGVDVPRVLLPLGAVLAVVVGAVVVGFKELGIVAFDPALARSMGIPAGVIHAAMLALVAAATVVSFEAVGSVLVVAMLIAPCATARLITDRLGWTYGLSALLAASAASVGYALAAAMDAPVAGMISVVAGGQFALAALVAPSHGMAARAVTRLGLALRITREDILGLLFRWDERRSGAGGVSGRAVPPLRAADVAAAIGSPWTARLALWGLHRRRMIERAPDGTIRPTEAGRASGASVVRTHRLWEAYLARHLGLPLDHLHAASHRAEHFIPADLEERVRAEVGDPVADPHGRPIPRAPNGPDGLA